jgi:hypothetical protein
MQNNGKIKERKKKGYKFRFIRVVGLGENIPQATRTQNPSDRCRKIQDKMFLPKAE